MVYKMIVVFLRQGLQELGLIEYIGNIMVELIKRVPPDNQMLVALVLVVWISALSSSFIDNIPFTTATVSAEGRPLLIRTLWGQKRCPN